MLFTDANEYVIAFLSAQVESGVIDSSVLDSWKNQEEGFKTLLEKNEKKKEKKDKNAPKGAKSAYILFCADERPKVKEEEPGMDAKKIAAELGKRWKELKEDDEEKVKEYQKMAEEDKVRFQKEMENYVPDEIVEKEKTKKKKDKNAPKGARSAYILFCADERAQVKEDIPEINAKEIISELGKRWKAVDDETKTKYQKMADEDKVRFKNEMENYVPGEEVEEEKEKVKKKKDKNAPKGARSAYILFCTDERAQVKEDMPDISAKDVLVELGKRWKAVSEKVKTKYQKMADEDKVRFKNEMENYVPGEDIEEEKEKVKKKKDKNAPKGARSAYIFFCADERAQVKEDIPDISAKDVLVELGKRWKALKDDDEDRYNEYLVMAEKDKVRFKKEMENYVPEDSEEPKEKKEKKTKDAPKRSKTAYQLYCEEQKEAVKQDGFEGKDIIAELARRWKELESEDEEYFKELKGRAEKLKKEFQDANPVEEKEKKIKKTEKVETEKVEKKEKAATKSKAKVVKKKTNKEIVHEIMDSFDDDETITMRMIKKKLDEMKVEIEKNELKEIVNDYNNDE